MKSRAWRTGPSFPRCTTRHVDVHAHAYAPHIHTHKHTHTVQTRALHTTSRRVSVGMFPAAELCGAFGGSSRRHRQQCQSGGAGVRVRHGVLRRPLPERGGRRLVKSAYHHFQRRDAVSRRASRRVDARKQVCARVYTVSMRLSGGSPCRGTTGFACSAMLYRLAVFDAAWTWPERKGCR